MNIYDNVKSYVVKISLLWALGIIMPPVCTIRTEMVLNSCSRFSITVSEKIIRISTCRFLIHAKVSIFREMIIILLEHRYLVRYCHAKKKKIVMIRSLFSGTARLLWSLM